MPRTVYFTATTLDGYLADTGDSLAWLFVQDQDPTGPMNYDDFVAGIGAIALGATTYAWVRGHLAGQDPDADWPFPMPAYVFSHRDLSPPEQGDVRFVSGPVAGVHDELAAAAGEKDVWVMGGGDLAAQFADAGHLDELVLSIAPVTLGDGRALFPRRYDLRLVELARNGAFACARYAVVGPGAWG